MLYVNVISAHVSLKVWGIVDSFIFVLILSLFDSLVPRLCGTICHTKKALVQRSRLRITVRAYREIRRLKNNTQKENTRQKEKKIGARWWSFFFQYFLPPLFSHSLERGVGRVLPLSRKFMAHKLPWPWIFFLFILCLLYSFFSFPFSYSVLRRNLSSEVVSPVLIKKRLSFKSGRQNMREKKKRERRKEKENRLERFLL